MVGMPYVFNMVLVVGIKLSSHRFKISDENDQFISEPGIKGAAGAKGGLPARCRVSGFAQDRWQT